MIYGYARVSTDGQSVAAQVETLTAAGAKKIFKETASGASRERKQLLKVLAALQPGDVLLVTRLDRLARSTQDLLNMLARVVEKEALFKSLAETWADTTTAHGRLFITLLGGLAEFERELILARTSEGRKRALAQGRRFGPPPKLTQHQQREATARVAAGEAVREVARSYNVSHSMISRLCSRLQGV